MAQSLPVRPPPDPAVGWFVAIGCALSMLLPSAGLTLILLAGARYVWNLGA